MPKQPNSDWEFSWIARNLTPVRGQKIHWVSEPGSSTGGAMLDVSNNGQVRFARRGPESVGVSLTISYEVPAPLAPFASVSFLSFFVFFSTRGLLFGGLAPPRLFFFRKSRARGRDLFPRSHPPSRPLATPPSTRNARRQSTPQTNRP
jgi:hypothetical protein